MKEKFIYSVLERFQKKEITLEEAYQLLKELPFKELEEIKIDYHRSIRKLLPEVIFCKGKNSEQILKIIKEMKDKSNIIITKASNEIIDIVKENYPEAEVYKNAGVIFIGEYPIEKYGTVGIITAGSADMSVATEALVILKSMGIKAEFITDVGAAGIHRILPFKEKIEKSDILIVIAGMDGVLPTVLAGLFDKPIIAVPTSIGYGANFNGIAPLLTMLNSCAPGIVVVNIDNGFGAAYFAGLIIKNLKK